jgi:hypothetical protein
VVKQLGGACPDVRTGWVGDFLETGDVIHVQGCGLLSRLIRWFSRACSEPKTWASHSAMVLRVGDKIEIIEALRKVVVRPISEYARTRARLLVCRKPGGLDPDQKKKIIEKAQDYRGRRYGVGKIVAHALDRLFDNRYIFRRLARMDDYPICSWLVAYVYDRVLNFHFGVPPNAAQPDDLLDHCVQAGWRFVWADSSESVADFCTVYELTAAQSSPSETLQVSEIPTDDLAGGSAADQSAEPSGATMSPDENANAAGDSVNEIAKGQTDGE